MHRFFVIGDWGRRGAPGQRAVARAMAVSARRLRPRAIISTGDNFYEDGVASLRDRHWRESFEDIYDDPALAVPWWVCLGNHDNRGCVRSQRLYTEINPRWQLPSRWHAMRIPAGGRCEAEFLFVDTSLMLSRHRAGGEAELPGLRGLDHAAQFAWLERTLRASTADWKVVVGHHPILSGSPCHGSAGELQATLLPLLERYGVAAYLAGHEHDLQHLVTNDLHLVVSGAGAQMRETGYVAQTRFAQGSLGFVILDVSAAHLSLTFVDEENCVLHSADIESPAAQERRAALG